MAEVLEDWFGNGAEPVLTSDRGWHSSAQRLAREVFLDDIPGLQYAYVLVDYLDLEVAYTDQGGCNCQTCYDHLLECL